MAPRIRLLSRVADLHLIGFELLPRSMMRPLHRGGCLQPGHRTAESGITHAYPQPRGTPSTPSHQPGTNSAAYLAQLAHPRRYVAEVGLLAGWRGL